MPMSLAQANAVLAMVRQARGELGPDERATLSELVGGVQWFDDHGLPILSELSDATFGLTTGRDKQQKYKSFFEFFTELGKDAGGRRV